MVNLAVFQAEGIDAAMGLPVMTGLAGFKNKEGDHAVSSLWWALMRNTTLVPINKGSLWQS